MISGEKEQARLATTDESECKYSIFHLSEKINEHLSIHFVSCAQRSSEALIFQEAFRDRQ